MVRSRCHRETGNFLRKDNHTGGNAWLPSEFQNQLGLLCVESRRTNFTGNCFLFKVLSAI